MRMRKVQREAPHRHCEHEALTIRDVERYDRPVLLSFGPDEIELAEQIGRELVRLAAEWKAERRQ
jgi:hypothetical protein